MPAVVTSLIRTIVPIIVGAILSVPLVKALGITADQAAQLVTAGLIALYYAAARVLEHYVSPRFGWLLGSATAPTYTNDKTIPGAIVAPQLEPPLGRHEAPEVTQINPVTSTFPPTP